MDRPHELPDANRIINLWKEKMTMRKTETGAKDRERFAKKAGKAWLDPMCTPVNTIAVIPSP